MKRIVAIALGLVLVLGMSPARADINVGDGTDTAMLRQAVKTDRRALVAATVPLTNAEAKKFWPIYESYQRAMDVINRQRNVALEALLPQDVQCGDARVAGCEGGALCAAGDEDQRDPGL